jgi:enoyl-CoA hydratase/carnithine racemase
MTELVLRSDIEGACFLTLNRPEVLNALNLELFAELRAHVEALERAGTDISCVVLRGAGRAFCSGHDLVDIKEGEKLPEPHYQARIIDRLSKLPQPLIASIHGYCFTGGLELALAADLIITTPSTKFGDTHSKWGLSPLWGMTQRLPRRVGMSKAKEMMFTSGSYSGTEALAMGLADRCVPDDKLEEETTALVSAISANSPHTNKINKEILIETDGMELEEGLDYELDTSPGLCVDGLDRLATFSKG